MMHFQIERHAEVASTNDLALARGKAGAPEGTLILAEYQTAGRGRYGRHWTAPHGKCILASVILRHRLLRDEIALPNLIGALSIAQAIHATTRLAARIKMPNDVRIRKKKIAGALTELAADRQRQPFFVLGFGVNVNITEEEFPPELRDTATSVRIESNADAEMCRGALLQSILHRLEDTYLLLKSGKTDCILKQVNTWKEREKEPRTNF
ncbi:biotin--[acetyl-CoA-carboxylase] ligase [Candidatus Poribacteria bacterium]|nr:MAG: biotin--[acetyl-CoA-carboxylase] ligase [Candidatus Poribacteria bacterium]